MMRSTFDQTKRPRTAAVKSDSRVQLFVVYGAFLLIAVIVFGTLSFRPF